MLTRLKQLLVDLTPSGGIVEQAVKSGIWQVAMNVIDRVLQLAMMVVIARLVGPSAIGLMGIALLGLSTVRRFSQLGLNEALIQKKEENVDTYLNTTLTLQVLRGLVIGVVLFLAAPAIAAFLGEPEATDIIRAIGVVPVISGVKNPGVIYFQKNLDFHKQFVYRLSGSVAQFAVGVGYALVSPTVWALVAGYLAARTMQLVVSYLAHDYRPRPAFDLAAAKELVGYGKWITAGGLVYFLYSEGDDAVVAWVLSAASLGFYQMAYRLANAPATELSEVIRRVTFPTYSKIQEDTATLREGFFRTLQVTSLVAAPAAVGLAAVTPTFVRAVLGPKWTSMVLTMQILTVYGLLLSVTATFSPVWNAIGRPDISTKLGTLRVLLMAVLIVPVTSTYGIEGTAALVVGLYVFPMLPLDCYFLVESIDTTYRRLVGELSVPLVASGVMGLAVFVAQLELVVSPAVELVVLIALGAVVYTGVMLGLERRYSWGLERNLRTVFDAVRG